MGEVSSDILVKGTSLLHPFSMKEHLFIVLIIVLVGLSNCSNLGQAGLLRALQRAKMREDRENTVNKDWVAASDWVDDDELFSRLGDIENDVIQGGLPGQPSGVKFKQYAGYITVNEANGRNLFYYFAEAVDEPSSKPLVLWLNGGPGCSSLGIGAMIENGPFGVKADGGTLYMRKYAWNNAANTLFLESPIGVGFSYSNTTSDYDTSGDTRTAQDTFIFLINWLKRFPQYQTRDLYITGESYAGFYIPELADIIIHKNKQGGPSSKLQLKGIMIGNGIMDMATDERGRYDYLWSHALISDQTHQGLIQNCVNFINFKCLYFEENLVKEVGNINFNNIYSPNCPSNSSFKLKSHEGSDPCEEYYVQFYLNLPQVQQALHANTTKLPYPWVFCSSVIHSWRDSPSTILPIYKRLISANLRILLYSGDVDAVVSVSSTRYSVNALNLTVIKPWHPWSDNSNEVAGYRVVYEGLTFATVRGAGHEVPRFQPHRAWTLLKSFLVGK